jgi:carbonic anhydrase/acetyltransferase-like protein (isoleucine patch superfamily)
MTIRNFETHQPQLHPSVFVDKTALVSGQVQIGEQSSVWPMAVLRGDIHWIHIGMRSNIQDGSVLHVTHASDYARDNTGFPLSIGDDVTIGHHAILHGCTIHNRSLIGMGTIVLDGATVEEEVIIGAGSLVPPNKVLKSGYLWLGSPVKRVRALNAKEKAFLSYSAQHYVKLAQRTANSMS